MALAADWKPETGGEPVTTKAPRPGTPPPEPAELAPLFPELEIEGLLGAGGMGAVYKAKQRRLGRAVALKVLHGELSGDALFVERFLREAQALAKLAHPGIVAIHDFGERERRCYLVMEYVDGTNLRALLKQGLLAPRQSLDIVRQLCDSLQFAHDEGVVHRDIKPENVLVDRAGRVKIADFGLAKLVGAPAQATLTSAGQVMGTPHYMAPEQVERPRDVDHRADLFSLGVVFYEMLTGELPLGRFAPPSERVQVDVRLDEIVLKSLERERERRYQHAAQVKTDVERIERQPAAPAESEEDELSGLRSGVYLPRLQAAFGRHRPPAWAWLALSTVAWIVCGASFDLGALWFILLSVPLLAWLFLSMVASRSGAEPAQDEHAAPEVFVEVGYGEQGRSRQLSRRVALDRWVVRMGPGAFFTVCLGFVALFVAHVAGWERYTWNYSSSPQAPMAGLERWAGRDAELLEHVGITSASRPDLASADLQLEAESAHWLDNPYALLRVHPAVHLSVALLLLLGGAWLAGRGGTTPRAGVASSMLLLLLPLPGLHALTYALRGESAGLEVVQTLRECRGDAHALAGNLYATLVAQEIEVHAELSARIVEERSGEVLGEVHVLASAPASVFERWSMTWHGPERLEPHVLFTIVSDPSGERALLLAEGGTVDSSRLATSDWSSRLRETLRVACETTVAK